MAIRGGSFLLNKQPVFSYDGKFVLLCTGCNISVLSVVTGLRVAELQGHADTVTSVVVVHGPQDAKSALTHAWTSSLDGTIRLWNFISGTQIRLVNLARIILSMAIPALSKPLDTTKPQLLAFLSVEEADETNSKSKEYTGLVVLHDLIKGKTLKGHLAKTNNPSNLLVSQRGNLVGMTENCRVMIWKSPAGEVNSCKYVQGTVLHPWRRAKVMAFDPTETIVAAGDEIGRVFLWRNVGERTFSAAETVKERAAPLAAPGQRPDANDDAESCTILHWHAQEVTALSFTSDGAYLLSGGLEAVLVLWQLETAGRQFLPRLSAPLSYITNSPVPALFAISLADNSLIMLNVGSMKMERALVGIKRAVPWPDKLDCANVTKLALHRDGRVVIPTVNVTLQFYDVFRDRQAFQIHVSPRNFVSTSDESKEKFAQSTLVTHVAFSADASVMVTVDSRAGQDLAGEGSSFKFWTKTAEKVPYALHTSVDSPHSGEILALAYHPSEHLVVTCSRASDFKTWSRSKTSDGLKHVWKCNSAGSYKEKQMLAAAFSPDGTLLAVAAEECITLWNPLSNSLLCALEHPGARPEVVGLLAFVPDSPFLVSAAYGKQSHLAVWSLSTLAVCWSYSIAVEAITVDPDSLHFAVLARRRMKKGNEIRDAQICLFNPASPIPLSVWSFKHGVGGALNFLPANFLPEDGDEKRSSKLIALNRLREYIIFDPFAEADSEPEPNITAKPAVDAMSAFEVMYGPIQASRRESSAAASAYSKSSSSNKPWGNLLNGPSHILPSLSKVGLQILDSFLEKRVR